MKKVVTISVIIISILAAFGIIFVYEHNGYKITTEDFIFTKKNLTAESLEEVKKAFSDRYSKEPVLENTVMTWDCDGYSFYNRQIETANIVCENNQLQSIYYTFPAVPLDLKDEDYGEKVISDIDDILDWFHFCLDGRLKVKGEVYLDGEIWEENYIFPEVERAKKLTMVLKMLESGPNNIGTRLEWKSENRYVVVDFNSPPLIFIS